MTRHRFPRGFLTLMEREQKMLGDIDAFLGEEVSLNGQVEAQ